MVEWIKYYHVLLAEKAGTISVTGRRGGYGASTSRVGEWGIGNRTFWPPAILYLTPLADVIGRNLPVGRPNKASPWPIRIRAVEREFEIRGEAARNVDETTRQQFRGLDFRYRCPNGYCWYSLAVRAFPILVAGSIGGRRQLQRQNQRLRRAMAG